MKRFFAMTLVLCICITCFGCGSTSKGQTNSSATEKATEPTIEPIPLKLGESVTAGIWQYTLVDLQFAREIGNYSEYENYLVPGGKSSSSNPFALEDNETFAVATYKLKMLGKEARRPWDAHDGAAVGTGRFIYSDGFVFDAQTDGSRAQASYYDGDSFTSMVGLSSLEPLSDEIECRVDFALPTKTIEDKDEPLVYEISFDESGDNMKFIYVIR